MLAAWFPASAPIRLTTGRSGELMEYQVVVEFQRRCASDG
jgi:hypothetical protein